MSVVSAKGELQGYAHAAITGSGGSGGCFAGRPVNVGGGNMASVGRPDGAVSYPSAAPPYVDQDPLLWFDGDRADSFKSGTDWGHGHYVLDAWTSVGRDTRTYISSSIPSFTASWLVQGYHGTASAVHVSGGADVYGGYLAALTGTSPLAGARHGEVFAVFSIDSAVGDDAGVPFGFADLNPAFNDGNFGYYGENIVDETFGLTASLYSLTYVNGGLPEAEGWTISNGIDRATGYLISGDTVLWDVCAMPGRYLAWLNGTNVLDLHSDKLPTPSWGLEGRIGASCGMVTGGDMYLFNGDICEVMLYEYPVDGGQRDRIAAYLKAKWGIS